MLTSTVPPFLTRSKERSTFWSSAGTDLRIGHPRQLIAALAELQDPHVSLVGKSAGKTETLGVLFRTSSDGNMVVWRVFDGSIHGVSVGERVLAIDGLATQAWLQRAASMTFGGNRRGRYAEAALDLGLGTPIVHRTAHLGNTVHLLVKSTSGARRTIALEYRPMNAHRALALAMALDKPDLPAIFTSNGMRVGTLRIGAFAAQYDPLFLAASARVSKKQGATDDQAMQAGYCAVTSALIKRFDFVARDSDVIVLDLRGNLGGFDREARLEADAIAPSTPARTFDLFATGRPGIVRLAEQQFRSILRPCRDSPADRRTRRRGDALFRRTDGGLALDGRSNYRRCIHGGCRRRIGLRREGISAADIRFQRAYERQLHPLRPGFATE